MLERDGGLGPGRFEPSGGLWSVKMSRLGWLKPAQYQVLPGGALSCPTLISLVALPDLPLGPVEHDPYSVLAIEKLHVIKDIALV